MQELSEEGKDVAKYVFTGSAGKLDIGIAFREKKTKVKNRILSSGSPMMERPLHNTRRQHHVNAM